MTGLFTIDSFEAAAVIKLIIAAIFGGALGLEREITKHPAGFRTHVLVTLGSCCFMLLTFAMMSMPDMGAKIDPSRIVQGVITGMGFIGGGAIMKEGLNVRGITTAASLWVASAIGLLVSTGFFLLALFMTVLTLAVLIVSRALTKAMSIGKNGNGDQH